MFRKQKQKDVVGCRKMIEWGKCGHVMMMCESRYNWPEEKTCAPDPSPVYVNSHWVSFVVSFFRFFLLGIHASSVVVLVLTYSL